MKDMKQKSEFETFDNAMRGLLAVPYSELQKKLEQEKRDKGRDNRKKKKRTTLTVSSRVSSSRTKRAA